MPQATYGVIGGEDHREGAGHGSTAQTPLFAREDGDTPGGVYKKSSEGSAGITSSVGNLANTILGTGVLAFPLVSSAQPEDY